MGGRKYLPGGNKREQLTRWYHTIKAAPCLDCGGVFPPEVMQFDHVRRPKVMAVSHMVAKLWDRDRIAQEIAKCELVCANCHQIRTRSGARPQLSELVDEHW
jgi:hypothetical protein